MALTAASCAAQAPGRVAALNALMEICDQQGETGGAITSAQSAITNYQQLVASCQQSGYAPPGGFLDLQPFQTQLTEASGKAGAGGVYRGWANEDFNEGDALEGQQGVDPAVITAHYADCSENCEIGMRKLLDAEASASAISTTLTNAYTALEAAYQNWLNNGGGGPM
ncbi:hypothetical protein [Rhodopirellula baltica]|nr:hypothetical protein [Rhodopirellula baltica]